MLYQIWEMLTKECGSTAWEVLDITQQSWCTYKKNNEMPLKYYKIICNKLGIRLTDDNQELSQLMFNIFWEIKRGERTIFMEKT